MVSGGSSKGNVVVYTLAVPLRIGVNMSKEAVFTMKLEPDLRADFMAAAQASHRPASQILRELMRDFVQRQRQSREYEDFLHSKVDRARKQVAEGQLASHEDVESRFEKRRAEILAKSGDLA